MTLEKTPRQNRVRQALGRIYDHHPPYFREYLRRYQQDPTSRVFAPLAEAYRRLGQIDEAIEVCKEGLEHHPDFQGGRVALAKCYIDKKMFLEARAELDRVIQFVPENLLAQRLLGEVSLALKDRVRALHCFKMALMLSPSDVGLAERVHALEVEASGGRPAAFPFPDFEDNPEMSENKTPESPLAPPEEPAQESEIEKALRAEGEDLAPLWDAPLPKTETGTSSEKGKGEASVEDFFGEADIDEDAFKVEHVSAIFSEERVTQGPEITTETLGDLYFSQGQYDKSLRIFEKLGEKHLNAELKHKIMLCRMKMGVETEALVRKQQIQLLRGILKKLRAARVR
jgi:tetratricopeptide (TPR) repeat protein